MSVNHHGSKILVVDDEEVIRRSFGDQLEDLGYLVLLADCGDAALQIIKDEMPDLVLTDLRMPGMSGLELIKSTKVFAPDIPIIVISGAGVLTAAVDALKLGAYDYLIKPVNGLHILEHAVEQALENARLIRENQEYQLHLEDLVHERTIQLEMTNQRLEDLNSRLKKIVTTTQGFNDCIDVMSISTRILDEFADHMCATGGSLYFIETEGLRLIHTLDPGHALNFIPFPLVRASVFNKVLDTAQPLLIEDIAAIDGTRSSGWSEYKNGSLLSFPLPKENGEVMGLLTLHSKEPPPFVEQDKEIGAILASYSCEAIRAVDASEKIRESEKRFRELADMLPLAVFETDAMGRIIYHNRKTESYMGYSSDELSYMPLIEAVKPEQRDKVIINSMKVIQNGEERSEGTEYTVQAKDGTEIPVLAYSAPIFHDEIPVGMRSAVIDITLIKQQQEQILRHAHFDSLTGLPNRFLALDRLSQLIKESQRTGKHISVLFLDLDDFKKVNDTLGHAAGDQLLIQAGERLESVLREGDTVARLGGDEFVVLVGGLEDVADARPVARNLLEMFQSPFLLDGRELLLTLSIGISIHPIDGETPEQLLQKADSAMYYSKDSGRNTFNYFTDDMNKTAKRRLQLEEQMHGVLGRDELFVEYQPLVALKDNSIIGIEALLRWNNPTLGRVGPDEFIPLMEHSGQIVSVGQFVIMQAISFVSQINGVSDGFKVAVNMSPRQFRDPSLIRVIRDELYRHKLDGNILELEITEGVLINSSTHVNDILHSLCDLGVSISMDDFGTGYSSLSYLRKYPFNTLKIDRSFVKDITDKASDRELVSATIQMGQNLGLSVIAEGVETEEQLTILKQLGCDMAQGYYFSKPCSGESIIALLETGKAQFEGA